MISFRELSPKKQRLLVQSLADFDARWDEEVSLLKAREDGQEFHATRETVFYALALLLRGEAGDHARADRALRAVLALQRLQPGQIWHGTFATYLEQPAPAAAPFDTAELTPLARWQGDVLTERLTAAFASGLQENSRLRPLAPEILSCLNAGLLKAFPVVWNTYDPNWREFLLAAFALILEHFEDVLPAETVQAMDAAARAGLQGARLRAEQGLTPLNTNVEVMHVFIFDAFARRFGDASLAAWAASFAEKFTEEYLRLHAVAEFNSPTYNGVVLTYTSFLRHQGGSPEVRRMGEVLEDGLWADLAEFYNPSLEALCGPYSRAYGLSVHGTALPLLMYLALDAIPAEAEPLFGAETESASILCCGEYRIPEETASRLLSFRGERTVTKQFRELAERGKPGENHALCTATAWITENLMLGACRGSTNTSHQLHAATVHWRNSEGTVSGLRLRRRKADGGLVHLRTVLLNLTAGPGKISGTVRNDSAFEISCDFEFQSPGAAKGIYEPSRWQADGLVCVPSLSVSSPDRPDRTAEARPEVQPDGTVWCRVPLAPGETLRLDLAVSLTQR